ncbi:hypothetical protein WJX84_008569 [Apatococcus fuscideae]|uniref:Uncharacterized protein n=1 Tax=Apatococcus fuscideae TaxID=2026836 RepID=A0AAW1THB2_9CHLO
MLEAGIQKADVKSIKDAVSGKAVLDEVSDHTIPIIPYAKNLRMSHHRFASNYVADQVFSRLLESAYGELMLFLQSSANLSELDLQTEVSTTINVPPRQAFIYSNPSEMSAQTSRVYCIPKNKNEESVDFIQSPQD